MYFKLKDGSFCIKIRYTDCMLLDCTGKLNPSKSAYRGKKNSPMYQKKQKSFEMKIRVLRRRR